MTNYHLQMTTLTNYHLPLTNDYFLLIKVRAFANAHPEEYFNESIRHDPKLSGDEVAVLRKQARWHGEMYGYVFAAAEVSVTHTNPSPSPSPSPSPNPSPNPNPHLGLTLTRWA